MEEQYELAYQARCLISLLFGKYDPHGVDYLHKHLDFRTAFVTLKFPLAILRTTKMTMMRTTSVWCSVTCTKAVRKF